MARSAGLMLVGLVLWPLLTGCPMSLPVSGDLAGADTGAPIIEPPPDTAADDLLDEALAAEFPGCGPAEYADEWRAGVLSLVNRERTTRGLDGLIGNDVLGRQAEQYACEMIYYDFFAHENPVTGSTLRERADEFGYEYSIIGENLAAGQLSPVEVVADWMASPGHRENILDARFTEIGIGIRAGGDYGLYWVLEFGCPR